MAKILKFQDRMHAALTERLVSNGFVRVNRERILAEFSRFKPGQPLVYGNEEQYILNLNNGKPIFVVFVKKDEKTDTLTVITSNPREDRIGSTLTVKEQYLKKTLRQALGTPESIADSLMNQLKYLAELKKDLRAQIHFHSRFLIDGEIAHDDGYSHFNSIVRRALLHHVDFLVYTPHNAFEYGLYRKIRPSLEELGITLLLATEITMPILKKHPNGPHHLVIAGNEEAAKEVSAKILERCEPDLKMVSYFLGMTMDEMYDVLKPLKDQGLVITGVAHPVNFSDKILPIRGIGLFSAVDAGHISWEDAVAFARRNHFIEAWNDSIYEKKMTFSSKRFEKKMRELKDKFKLPGELSPNLCNLALALKFEGYGLGQTFGSDAHIMPAFERSYHVGGDPFSRGWSVLEVPPEKLPKERRFNAEEFVSGVAKGEIKLGAVMFTQMIDGVIRLVESRREMSEEIKRDVKKQSFKQYVNYIEALIHDAFGFLDKGQLKELENMPK